VRRGMSSILNHPGFRPAGRTRSPCADSSTTWTRGSSRK
jgi:hypothetical protein